jgi:hypothetical protein
MDAEEGNFGTEPGLQDIRCFVSGIINGRGVQPFMENIYEKIFCT